MKGAVAKVLADLSKAPVPKQIAVGGAAGWTAGYLTMKAGKMAATAIGGSLLLLQIAHHKGYIKVQSTQHSFKMYPLLSLGFFILKITRSYQ